MGKTNWRRRWFKLVQKRRDVLLEYYRGVRDRTPAGSVKLNVTCRRFITNQPNYTVNPVASESHPLR